MRDDRLLQLVRMAGEADELERGSRLVLTDAPHPSLWRRMWAPLTAMAAAAALAVVLWPVAPGPVVRPGPGPVAIAPTGATPDEGAVTTVSLPTVAEPCQPSGPMLLAVFHQPDERCDCVVWRAGAFVETDIRRLGSAELIEAAWTNRCADSSNLVLVVAIDGPPDELPQSAEAALELAANLSIPRAWCGENAGCYEDSAMGVLPSSVKIVAETLSMSAR